MVDASIIDKNKFMHGRVQSTTKIKIKGEGEYETFSHVFAPNTSEFDPSIVELYKEFLKWLFLDTDEDVDVTREMENKKILLLVFSLINFSSNKVMQ